MRHVQHKDFLIAVYLILIFSFISLFASSVLILCLVFSVFILYFYVFLVLFRLFFLYINLRVRLLKGMLFFNVCCLLLSFLFQPCYEYVRGFLDFHFTPVFILFLVLFVGMFPAHFTLWSLYYSLPLSLTRNPNYGHIFIIRLHSNTHSLPFQT